MSWAAPFKKCKLLTVVPIRRVLCIRRKGLHIPHNALSISRLFVYYARVDVPKSPRFARKNRRVTKCFVLNTSVNDLY